MTLLLYGIGLPGYAMFLLVASGYWLLPLLISAWEGTVLNTQAIEKIAAALESLGSPGVYRHHDARLPVRPRRQTCRFAIYLTDLTTFVCGRHQLRCLAWHRNPEEFHRAVKEIVGRQDPACRPGSGIAHLSALSPACFCNTQHMAVRRDSRCCAASFFVYLIFGTLRVLVGQQTARYCSGLAFAVMVGAMVFAAVWGSLLLVLGSLMLARVISLPIDLRSFIPTAAMALLRSGSRFFYCGPMPWLVGRRST